MAVQENCCNSRKTFWGILGVAEVFGLLAITLLVMWNVAFNKGYIWGHGNQQFSIHPLVMILGMVYLYGNGAVVFRVLECISRFQAKIVHMVIMSIILILSVFGVYTVFNYHAMMHYGNMYTMHSWCGMMNVVAFGLQFFVGFAILLWPGAKGKIRNIYMPIHRYSSFGVMAITVGSIASGVVEDLLMCIDNREYRELPLHAVIFNVVGMLCIAYILLIMYLTYRDDWKRGVKLTPAEEAEESAKPIPEQSTSGPAETDKLLPK